MKTKMVSCKIGDETEKLIMKKVEDLKISRSRVIEGAIVKGLSNNSIEPNTISALNQEISKLRFMSEAGYKLEAKDFQAIAEVVNGLWQ